MKRHTGINMNDNPQKPLYDQNSRQHDSEGRFHFWLIVAALAVFIFLLFYSQKIHGLM